MNKKISIVIATYNAGKTLAKCLDSIIIQKTTDTEIIVIDGGSTDNTVQVLEERRSTIDYFNSEPDKGIYDAWNKGIEVSSGKWIMFLGADDELLPGALNTYLSFLADSDISTEIDYICSHDELVSQNGKFLRRLGKEPTWDKMRCNMAAAHVASLHNKENLFNQVGVYDLKYKICADYELLLRKGDNLKYIYMDNWIIARMMDGGISTSWKAVVETYRIRRDRKTVSPFMNIILLIKSLIGYKLYKYLS